MKTILVPTDFSEASKNAIEYVTELAHFTCSKIILLHAYHTPPLAVELPIVMISNDEVEKDCMDSSLKLKEFILSKQANLSVVCICKCGFIVDVIKEFVNENHIDLIVMGMQGTGLLSEKLVGSITTLVIREIKIPVLSIRSNVKFTVPKKIVLAIDDEKIKESVYKPLKEIAELFESHVYRLNIDSELESVSVLSNEENIEEVFNGIKYSNHRSVNKDVLTGINNFCEEFEMDMLVMIPRKKSIFQSIFTEPITKKMAFHTSIPLLAIHE